MVPDGEQACITSGSSRSSCVEFIILKSGLESLHESQLANQPTVLLKSCASLREIATCLVAARISVHEVALMPCSLTQRLQKTEPAS